MEFYLGSYVYMEKHIIFLGLGCLIRTHQVPELFPWTLDPALWAPRDHRLALLASRWAILETLGP